MKPLTDKQEKFKNLVLKGVAPQDAYVKAGYKARGEVAYTNARRLLKNAHIRSEIEKSRKIAAYRAEVSVERVLKEEMCLAFADVTAIFAEKDGCRVHPRDLPESVRRAISGIDVIEAYAKGGEKITKYKYRFWDKGRSLERIGRHLAMYQDEPPNEGQQPPAIILQLHATDNAKFQVNICNNQPPDK